LWDIVDSWDKIHPRMIGDWKSRTNRLWTL
jgi:hypothetical protein